MRIKRIELSNFKRFTHLTVEDIPETAKLIILVGPNGSGKTSFLESMNHYYKYAGFSDVGDYHYLSKTGNLDNFDLMQWVQRTTTLVDIDFYNLALPKSVGKSDDLRGRFYFRSAYRNEPDFQINSMEKLNDPTKTIRLSSLIQNDLAVSANYRRLVVNTISGMFNTKNDSRSVASLREELTGKISSAIERVFEDLKFSSLGEPLTNGNFYFSKGTTENFSYKNLSSGEKSAFDLILDMVVQSEYYPDAIYCIDEPEAHMHTKLQGKVLRELYRLVPESSQFWLSTHSIGMLQEAAEIEQSHPGTVIFLDFEGKDFDTDQVIRPAKIGKALLNKFYELAFGDFSKLILPQTVVFCEGDPNGGKRKDFDKIIYSTIFADTHPEAVFISAGSCNDIEKLEETHGGLINTLLKNSRVIKLIDCDDRSEAEISELGIKGIRVLKERNIESYLLDDTVIEKLCESVGQIEKYEDCINAKNAALKISKERGNASDDYKSARSTLYTSLKQILSLTKCGNTPDSFIRDTLTPLITPDMDVYKRLDSEIFGTENCR